MSLPFTSVVSYHTNPLTCGVAKFSAELAKRLGVPFVGCDECHKWGDGPLLSLKWSELSERDQAGITGACLYTEQYGELSIFWHDAGDRALTLMASRVFYADPSLGSPGLWCPSLITPRDRPVRLFSFGMAHKLQTDKYQRVKDLLDAAGKRYHLRVSVGIHEGTSLDGAEKHFDALRDIMGPDNVTILGILSDDAVSEELANCEYVLAFFEKGLRANNTTVHAALASGRRVITNKDADTPLVLSAFTADINKMDEWPEPIPARHFSWDNLLEAMRKECEKLTSPAAR